MVSSAKVNTGCPSLTPAQPKAYFTPFGFYKRLIIVPVLTNQKKSKEDFHFSEMVTASSLYAILAYKRFHGNILLSDSGGNLYSYKSLGDRKRVIKSKGLFLYFLPSNAFCLSKKYLKH